LNDEKLAGILNNSLVDKSITGYIAVREKEYELYIVDKIKKQILDSDFLVAILTESGMLSPSVHEEIGYALGVDTKVLLMVEEKLKKKTAVLIHGKEPEIFTAEKFPEHCINITNI
jgi:hypothetical protein